MNFENEFNKIKERYLSGEDKAKTDRLIKMLSSRKIVIYGAGYMGVTLAKSFLDYGLTAECFCDSNKTGTNSETNLNIISPEVLKKEFSDANIIIAVADLIIEKNIYDFLISLGISSEQIFTLKDVYSIVNSKDYAPNSITYEKILELKEGYKRAFELFPDKTSKEIVIDTIKSYLFHDLFNYDNLEKEHFPDEIKLSDNEVFVDAGFYIGDTTEAFIKHTNGKFSHIYGFEIDGSNISAAPKNLSNLPNLEIISKGLWNETSVMHANLQNMASSNISNDGDSIVELVSLDEFFSSKDESEYPTYIKMDIEGSEKNALLGASRIIKAKKPKLAICVYHKPEDIFELPELILSLNPEYKIFLKKYMPYIWETVLYAY